MRGFITRSFVRRVAFPLLALAALALSRSAVAGQAAPLGTDKAQLTIAWSDPKGALPFRSGWVAKELRRTLADLELEISWREADEPMTPSARVHRVTLLPEDPVASRRRRRVMGVVAGKASSRTVWLFLSPIEELVDPNSGGGPVVARHRVQPLARAIGRVLAHELVHVLLPGREHAKTGLMRAQLRLEELAAPWPPRLDVRFRTALAQALHRPISDAPALVASRENQRRPAGTRRRLRE